MTDEFDKSIEPFTVRDALIQHDKQIHQLTGVSHETQGIVRNFEQKMEALMERINKGVSPTMQLIKDQNDDLKTRIVEFKGDVNTKFKEIEGNMKVQDEHFNGKLEDFDGKLEEIDGWRHDIKDFLWKVAASLMVAGIISMAGLYVYVAKMRSNLEGIIPAIQNLKSQPLRK